MSKSKNANKGYVLGVDGGGSKTLAAVTDLSGEVAGAAYTGASNFQGIGVTRAGINLKDAVDAAMNSAGISSDDLLFATYGIAGADRDADFDIVYSYVEPANPCGRYMITNDTTIALRAGTKDGVGVALIAGTGSNTIGFSKDYLQKKVGGLGPLTGDYGSAGDIAKKGVLAAMKSMDGRGPATLMHDMFCDALGIDQIEDIIAFSYIDNYKPLLLHKYAKVVFDAADAGDRIAIAILKKTGRQVGHEAVTCIKALFKKDEAFTVVLGGSVFQKGTNPSYVNTLTEYIIKRYNAARVVKLKHEPCLGALLWAMDCHRVKPVPMNLAKRTATSLSRAVKSLQR